MGKTYGFECTITLLMTTWRKQGILSALLPTPWQHAEMSIVSLTVISVSAGHIGLCKQMFSVEQTHQSCNHYKKFPLQPEVRKR